MAQNVHIIGRQIIDLEIGGGQDAFRVQQDVSFVLRNRVLPKLEELFDRFVGPERVIRIDQLEIDLGDIDQNSLEHELEEKLMRYVERALNEHLVLTSEPKKDEQGWQEMTRTTGIIELWVYFLEHGYLPWYATVANHTKWESEIIEVLATQPAIVDELMSRVVNNDRYLQRLVNQFSTPVLEAIIAARSLALIPRLLELNTFIQYVAESIASSINTPLSLDTGTLFWRSSLVAVFLKRSHDAVLEVITETIMSQISSHFDDMPIEQLIQFAQTEMSIKPSLQKIDKKWLKMLLDRLAEKLEKTGGKRIVAEPDLIDNSEEEESSVSEKNEDSASHIETEIETEKINTPESDGTDLKEETDTKPYDLEIAQLAEANVEGAEKKLKEGDFLYIRNAGLILFHPFLPRFFEALGLTHEKAFVDKPARVRAIQLIQYLATGEFDQPEYQMTLNKILCGHPLNEPIAREIVLTKTEEAEAQKLLQAVITHWTALKNTSPEGLQYNYFIREGKLTRKYDGWLLQVETKTQDILMNQLPWGVSMIQMPWMEGLLRIEWAY